MKTAKDPRHQKRQKFVQDLFSYSFQKRLALKNSLKKIIPRLSEIDKLIEKAAPQFPANKLNKIDLAILRLAVFELTIEKKEPEKVIIDEAVELGKEYGSDNSPKFINGVLGTILKKSRKKEKMSSLEDKIVNLVSQKLGVEPEEVKKNSHFFDDFNTDKVVLAELFLVAEKEFNIKIPPEELEKVKTVADLVKTVEANSDEII